MASNTWQALSLGAQAVDAEGVEQQAGVQLSSPSAMPDGLPSDVEEGRFSSNKDVEEQVDVSPRVSQRVFNVRISQAGRVSNSRVVRFSDRSNADDIKGGNKIWPAPL